MARFLEIASAANWQHFPAVRQSFPAADYAETGTVIFNVGGNKYRVVAYEELLAETVPGRIDNVEQYELIGSRFGDLLGKRRRTAAEDRLMGLLGVLIEDYDRRNAMPPDKSTPAELLQFLVDHSGKTATELLAPVFGQRSHVNEALNGKRPISAEQARKLGKIFSVSPGLFV